MVVQKKKILKLLIILILCIFVLLIVSHILNKRNENIIHEVEVPEGLDYFDPSEVKKVELRSDYILVERYVKRYFDKYSDKEYINKIIANEYLKLYNISFEDDEQSILLENAEVLINNMYVTEISMGIYFYFVDGNIINIQSMETQNFELGVIVDKSNRTCGIIPQECLAKMGCSGLNEDSVATFKPIDKIEDKEINKFQYRFVSENAYMIDYLFQDFLDKCLLDANMAYEYLDDEYREKKFGGIEGFQEYLNKKREIYEMRDISNMKKPEEFADYDDYLSYFHTYKCLEIVSCGMEEMGDYTQYILIDNYGNYYIFRETSTMQYKVILDTYTLELPEFIKEYKKESTDSKTKTALNAEKIVAALNDEDYRYVYSKLADSFKANYFTTLESFEEYAKNTFGTGNKAEYDNFIETTNYCTIDVTLKRGKKEVSKKIIMQLQEGTNFVMSFNVD